MPHFESNGIVQPDFRRKEYKVRLTQETDTELGNTVLIRDPQGDLSAIQKLRHDKIYDSDWEHTKTKFPTPEIPQEKIEVGYWTDDNTYKSVTYAWDFIEEDEVLGKPVSVIEELAVVSYAVKAAGTLNGCKIEYSDTGEAEIIDLDLETDLPLINHPHLSPSSRLVACLEKSYSTSDGPFFVQSFSGDGNGLENEVDDGLWGSGVEMEIVEGVKWKVVQLDNEYIVTIYIGEETVEFPFPRTLDPKEVRRLLLQKKHLGGTHKPSWMNNLV